MKRNGRRRGRRPAWIIPRLTQTVAQLRALAIMAAIGAAGFRVLDYFHAHDRLALCVTVDLIRNDDLKPQKVRRP